MRELGAIKQLTMVKLNELQEMPDLIGLTALTIGDCGKLRALSRRIGKLGALRELTIRGASAESLSRNRAVRYGTNSQKSTP